MKFLNLITGAIVALTARPAAVPTNNTTDSTDAEFSGSAILEGRGNRPLCDIPAFKQAGAAYIRDGIAYLRGVAQRGGKCSTSPRECNRVSCSYDAGIYVCNDNYVHIDPSCDAVADYADEILKSCDYRHRRRHYVNGQRFDDSNGWNVMVHGDEC